MLCGFWECHVAPLCLSSYFGKHGEGLNINPLLGESPRWLRSDKHCEVLGVQRWHFWLKQCRQKPVPAGIVSGVHLWPLWEYLWPPLLTYFSGSSRHDFAREKPLRELSSTLLGNHDCKAESFPRQSEEQPSALEETDVCPGEHSETLINLHLIHFTN